jgi:hypothetical protein
LLRDRVAFVSVLCAGHGELSLNSPFCPFARRGSSCDSNG